MVASEVKETGLGIRHPPDMLENQTEETATRWPMVRGHFAGFQLRLWFP